MQKINFKQLAKVLLLVLAAGLITFSAQNIYDSLSRAGRVNEELVESYRPHLEVELIKRAAGILKGSD